MNPDWREVQKRLKAKGFDPGPIDGIRGRLTNAAIKKFKRSVGLRATSYYGPITEAKLFGKPVPTKPVARSADLPWMDIARSYIGTREIAGKRHNPKIIGFAKRLGLDWIRTDEVAWCGTFVGSCIAQALANEPIPNGPAGARNWQRFGEKTSPREGAVLVFWRGKPSGWRGHVGFYVGEDATHYHVLGGNQSNAVNVRRIPKSRLLAARWPKTHKAETGERRVSRRAARTSDGNEA